MVQGTGDVTDRELLLKEEELKVRKTALRMSVLKVLIGTSLVGLTGAVLNHQIQRRAVEVQELQQLGQFVQYALNEELAIRRRFAEYFATVTTSPRLRQRWQMYADLMEDDWLNLELVLAAARDTIELSQDSLASLERRLARLDAGGAGISTVVVGRFDPTRTARCERDAASLTERLRALFHGLEPLTLSCATGVLVSRRFIPEEELEALGIQGAEALEEVRLPLPGRWTGITTPGVTLGAER